MGRYPAEVPVGSTGRRSIVLSPTPNAPGARPLRFSDVLDELESIGDMARGSNDPTGLAVAAACRRAQGLLERLREQFLAEVVMPDDVWAARQQAI